MPINLAATIVKDNWVPLLSRLMLFPFQVFNPPSTRTMQCFNYRGRKTNGAMYVFFAADQYVFVWVEKSETKKKKWTGKSCSERRLKASRGLECRIGAEERDFIRGVAGFTGYSQRFEAGNWFRAYDIALNIFDIDDVPDATMQCTCSSQRTNMFSYKIDMKSAVNFNLYCLQWNDATSGGGISTNPNTHRSQKVGLSQLSLNRKPINFIRVTDELTPLLPCIIAACRLHAIRHFTCSLLRRCAKWMLTGIGM
ncbi:hypothetical protein IEQ34_005205 [Dendrobium chrysotoxum]|uniref:Uncharacterized protein n=1 Tax=Dendrobium chrysotoxum TaxID=161865 RepID=A0AAV7H7X0_DENCH|nr:hypothetical protein IEQ34_005205 [Dendrobium chrysotoxum]